MRNRFATLLCVVLAACLTASAASAADNVLDNQAIVQMVHLGLDQQVIEAKIHASTTNFDTNPEALAKLKREHVPAAIIADMINAGSTAATGANGVNPTTNPGATSFQFVAADGARTSMSPVRVTADASYRKAWIPFHIGGPETFLFIQGRHAALHTGNDPAFTTNINPISVRLVHLGEKKDRDARYVVFSGSTTDREVQVTSTQVGTGLWQIKPQVPLQAGEEYAFLVSTNMPSACAFWACFAQYAGTSEAYDFGVQ